MRTMIGTPVFFDDNGEEADVSLLPNWQVAEEELSMYMLKHPPLAADGSTIKKWLETHKSLMTALLVIGDGVLTPAISAEDSPPPDPPRPPQALCASQSGHLWPPQALQVMASTATSRSPSRSPSSRRVRVPLQPDPRRADWVRLQTLQ